MAGLVPAIHALLFCTAEDVDARDIGVRKHAVLRTAMRGHDGGYEGAETGPYPFLTMSSLVI